MSENKVLIQIKTTPEKKKKLGYIKIHEEKTFTELLEEWIEFHYSLAFLGDLQKGEIKVLLEKYFDVKEMARGLLITKKTK